MIIQRNQMPPAIPTSGRAWTINDLFFFIENTKLANYADENMKYSTGRYIESLFTIRRNI